MPASIVSAPTLRASTTMRPVVLIDPPVTGSPGETSTGVDSPVTRLASTALEPSRTTPSVATFSPGRTMNWSPTTSSPTGIRVSLVIRDRGSMRRTDTSLAPRSSSERRASLPESFARASRKRPTSRNVVTTEATSK